MEKAYFISDIHLESMHERNAFLLMDLLKRVKDDGSHLYLLGDIFDVWVGSHEYFFEKFKPLIELIKTLVNCGIDVNYVEGNHDFHLMNSWQKQIGVSIFKSPSRLLFGSRKVGFEHGDDIDASDYNYQILKTFLRSRIMNFVAENLPGEVIGLIGEHWSNLRPNRDWSENQEVKERFRKFAKKRLLNQDVDFLIAGHTHIRDEYSFLHNGVEKTYYNLGTWLHKPTTLILTQTNIKFMDL